MQVPLVNAYKSRMTFQAKHPNSNLEIVIRRPRILNQFYIQRIKRLIPRHIFPQKNQFKSRTKNPLPWSEASLNPPIFALVRRSSALGSLACRHAPELPWSPPWGDGLAFSCTHRQTETRARLSEHNTNLQVEREIVDGVSDRVGPVEGLERLAVGGLLHVQPAEGQVHVPGHLALIALVEETETRRIVRWFGF